MPRKKIEYTKLSNCPHCGGLHLGIRFDDCPYEKLLDDPMAAEEQKHNAREWLRLHKADCASGKEEVT